MTVEQSQGPRPPDIAGEVLEAARPFLSSPTIVQIAAALAAAQAEISNPSKDKTAKVTSTKGNYSYDYADLAAVLETIRPTLSKHGIAVMQPPAIAAPKRIEVLTILLHKSGEWVGSKLAADIEDGRPQAVGSVITYLRRYQVMSLAGVAAEDDDDDGRHAQGNGRHNGRGHDRDERRDDRQPEDDQRRQSAPEPVIPKDGIYTPLQLKHLEKDKDGNPVVFGIYTAELGDWVLETRDREIARALVEAKKAGRKVVIEWATVNGHRVIEQLSAPPATGAAA